MAKLNGVELNVKIPEQKTDTGLVKQVKVPTSIMTQPQYSTEAVYKDASTFYRAGDTNAGNNVLANYYAQTRNKNSPYYLPQFSYWDEANGDEQKTLAAESDLLNMYNAVTDAVGKGYSDSWIKNNITAKNYAGLAGLDKDTVLTRQLQYIGDDTVNGMIYAARNGGDLNSGDILSAAGMYAMGYGNTYRPNYKSEAAKDPTSEIYHPYMQGNHAEGKDAEDNTIAAKADLEALQTACRKRLENGQSADDVYNLYFGNNMHGLDWGVDDEPAYTTLYDMETYRQNQSSLPLTEDVDFAAPYFKQWLYDQEDEIKAAKGELDDARLAQYVARQYSVFTDNVPESYQEAVMSLYEQDKGINADNMSVSDYSDLGLWLKEYGLVGAEDFGKAYNEASATLMKKWDEETPASTNFKPAAFISDGKNDDPETNDKQVAFRVGMHDYLAGRAQRNGDVKACINKYGFLFDNYDYMAPPSAMDDNPGAEEYKRKAESRLENIGSKLDAVFDKWDDARNKGAISDEEYLNGYLEVMAAYDNYLAAGGEEVGSKSIALGGWNKTATFDKYLRDTPAQDGSSLEDYFANKLTEQVDAANAAYNERLATEKSEVSKKFMTWERDANSGMKVEDPEFAKIREIKIDPSAYQNDLDTKYDGEYTAAYQYALVDDPTHEYGEHYTESYSRLASYDVAEMVNDIMRLAQYTGVDFATARQSMGFETYADLAEYIDNYSYAVNKKCSDIVESMYTVGGELLKSAAGTTADDLFLGDKIDLKTYSLFMQGMGNSENEQRFYNRVGDIGGINAASLVYEKALEEKHPKEGEAHGFNAGILDIAYNGTRQGFITHANAWVTAALGYQELTDAEREDRARLDYGGDPAAYRRAIEIAINDLDDPTVRTEMLNQLAAYDGDIFKFDFNANRITVALQNANMNLAAQRQALDEEMQAFFTPAAYKAYSGLGSAWNSGLISLEALFARKMFMGLGMGAGPASFLGQLVTTGSIEGGESAYKLKKAGVSSPIANITGMINGATIAGIEWGFDNLVNKLAYKTKWAKRIEDFGKIDTAAKVLQARDALNAMGLSDTAVNLLSGGMKYGLGTINFVFGTAKTIGAEVFQEVGETLITGGYETLAAELGGVDSKQFMPTLAELGEVAEATAISTPMQQLLPWNLGKSIIDTARNNFSKNNFVDDTRGTGVALKDRAMSKIGTLQNEANSIWQQVQADIANATADRQASMDKLKAMNIEARVDEETLRNLGGPALELKNSELTAQINELTSKAAQLRSQLETMGKTYQDAAARGEEARAAVENGDVSKEALDNLNENTNIVYTINEAIDQTMADIRANDEQLAKLKEEKQAARKAAYDAARQEAINTVMDEVTTDEAERLMDEIEKSDALIAEAKKKHEDAKNRVQEALEAYQEELKTFEAEQRAKAKDINEGSEDDIISDDLIDIALGITDEMREIDVEQAAEREASIKANLIKQLELSFPGFKVEMQSLGEGNHGRVIMNGGEKGTIVINSDSSSFELMNGELGYELGRIAQISSGADYKALYDAVTNAVYGSADGTAQAYAAKFEELVKEGVTTDLTQPNNATVEAGSEVFAEAIGRLLSGEFKNSKWVQSFSEKAPELAGDVMDWIAMRTKEFKTMAKHGGKQLKAQYNEIVDVLKQFTEVLDRATTEDFNGQTVEVDTTPMAVEEAQTDDVTDFVQTLVNAKMNEGRKRYVGKKRLPVFEKRSDGSYTIDRTGLTTEENDLISEVEKSELQAEYNALNGEVTADTLMGEMGEAIGRPLKGTTTAEERAERTKAKADRLETREERMARTEPATVAEQPVTPAEKTDNQKKLEAVEKKLAKLQEADDKDYQFILDNSKVTNSELSENPIIGEANEGQEEAVKKARKRRERRDKQFAKLEEERSTLQAAVDSENTTQTEEQTAPTTEETVQDNTVVNAEESAENTEDTALNTEEQTDTESPLADAIKGMIDQADQLGDETRQKVFGAIRGLIASIKNGDKGRSNADATNTPLAIIKKMMDNTGATMYQNALNIKSKTPAQVKSRPGFIATKRLLIRDVNEYINATGEHVMNTVQNEVDTNGVTTDLTDNTREANIALFNAWLTSGIDQLRGMSNLAVDTINQFADKLHLALINSEQGRKMWTALNDAKDSLAAYYNADAIRKSAAYVRSTPESQQSGQFNWWTKRKAEMLGQDLYGSIFDSMTGYGTQFRKALRYLPYAKSLGNMWIGDNDTAKGFIDLNRRLVPGAQTLDEAVTSPFDSRYVAKNREEVWDKVNLMLALQSALDRYTPLKRIEMDTDGNPIKVETNRDPFSGLTSKGLSEAAAFLGLEGHPTKASIQAAINELSKDNRIVEAAENVRQWWRNIMQIAVNEGVVSQETYDQFQIDNPHYAPLQRDMSTINKKGKHTNNGKQSTQGELDISSTGIAFRKAKGHSDRAIIDPLMSFAEMAQQMADKLVANRTAKEFVKVYDLAPYDTIGVFAGEITNGQANAMAAKGTDVLNVYYEDGKVRSFIVNNPELLELLQGKQLNADKSGWLKLTGYLTRFMSRLTTTDNPIFAIRNAIRDYQTSVNYGSWANSYIDGIGKWRSAFAECLKYTYSKSWNELFKGDNKGTADQQLRDFLFYGGEGFMRKSMTHNNKENIYGEVMGEHWGKRALSASWDLLTFGTLNDAVEMASRYVEYKYGKNQTLDSKGATDQSKFNAFMDSREVTVDFAQAGYGTLAKSLRQAIPFFNATLQGWYRTGRMFTKAEKSRRGARATKTILNNTIAGALSAAMCCFGKSTLGAFLGDDDAWEEQLKEYLKLSDTMKTDFILIPLTGLGFIGAKDFIRAPLLQDGLGKFCFNTGRLAVESIARKMNGEDVEVLDLGKDLVRIAFDVFKEPFTRDIVLKPIWDMAHNTTFYGTELVNKGKLDQDPDTWGNATTPQLAYDISNAERAALKWLFGENLPQWVNLIFSPAGVEYTFKEFFGYPGQVALPIMSRDKYTGDIKGLSGLASSIVGNFTLDAESSNDISSDWNDALATITSISKLTEYGTGISPLSSYLTSDERYQAVDEAKKALKSGGALKDIQDAVKDKWSEYNKIMSDTTIPEKEKQKAAEIIRKEINDLEAQGTAWVDAYKAKYMPSLGFVSSMVDSVKAGRQTLMDSGEGLDSLRTPTATTNPAELDVVQAGMPSAGDLTQTLPYEEEESENVQAPLTSPDYTGERVRGISTEFEGPTVGEIRRQEEQPKPTIEKQNDVRRRGVQIGSEMWNAALRETQKDPSKYYTGTWSDVPKAQAALQRGSTAMQTYQRGNVDLMNRPQIDASKLRAAGWDAEDGTATVFSTMYTAGNTGDYDYNWNNNTILHMTPIKADGTVLSQAELERYADSLLRNTTVDSLMEADKPENGGLGLMLWAQPVTGTLNNALKTGEQFDIGLHEAQEQYYLGGNNTSAQGVSQYNVASNVQDVSGIYAKKSRNGLDNWSRRNVRTLYGDALPESFYSEMETYMNADKTSTKYVPIPNDSYTVDSVSYNVKDYPGADVDVVNWYGDAYIEAYNKLINDPVYQNGTAEERMSMFKELDTTANTAAKRQFVLKYVSANTKGIANNLDERTMDVAMHLSKEYSARTNEATIRDVYGNNLPASWYSEFMTAWNTEKDTALLPFPSASVKVDSTTYYLTDYDGAQKDVMNWYADKYLAEYEKLTKTSAYINGSQADRASKLAALDSKANSFAMTNFKVKYLGITG